MVAPRVNAAGRMSTPDIATRLLLASDEGMADEAQGARRAARDREHPPPAGGAGHPRQGAEGDRDRSGSRGSRSVLVVAGEGWHRGVDRHRRLEDRRRVLSAGDRAVDRGRRGARVVPQHPRLRHAGGARIVRADAAALRRAQAGGRPADSRARGSASSVRRSTRTPSGCSPDDLRPRLWLDGPLALRDINSEVMAELARLAPFGPGESPAGVPHRPRGDRGRPAHPQRAPPQDERPAGRPRPSRHPVERRRARSRNCRRRKPAWRSPTPWKRTSSAANAT